MAFAGQCIDAPELLSGESKSMGRGGRSSEESSAQSMVRTSAFGVRSSSPAAGQGEGSVWDGSDDILDAEDSMNRAIAASDSASEGGLSVTEVAFGAVSVRVGSARLGGVTPAGWASSSRPA
jgi:hypothetical protein